MPTTSPSSRWVTVYSKSGRSSRSNVSLAILAALHVAWLDRLSAILDCSADLACDRP
jgi:hypothetical protein